MATKTNKAALRVLLIAPRSELPGVESEVQRVANALHPELLLGEATLGDVMDALSRGPYDTIWFAAHGGPDGVQFSDGLLSAETLTQLLRPNPPSLVVLNTCSSLQIANQLHDDVGCAVVGTVQDVPDRDAYVTGATLAAALARGLSVAEAYNVSRPGRNRQYVLLNGSVRLGGEEKIDDVLAAVMASATETQRRLTYMQQQIDQLRSDVQATHARLDSMCNRFAEPLDRKRALAWLGAFVLFVLFVGIIEFRDNLDMSLGGALAFALTLAAVSAWLFLYGLGFRWEK